MNSAGETYEKTNRLRFFGSIATISSANTFKMSCVRVPGKPWRRIATALVFCGFFLRAQTRCFAKPSAAQTSFPLC